jgi:hypothetical protein
MAGAHSHIRFAYLLPEYTPYSSTRILAVFQFQNTHRIPVPEYTSYSSSRIHTVSQYQNTPRIPVPEYASYPSTRIRIVFWTRIRTVFRSRIHTVFRSSTLTVYWTSTPAVYRSGTLTGYWTEFQVLLLITLVVLSKNCVISVISGPSENKKGGTGQSRSANVFQRKHFYRPMMCAGYTCRLGCIHGNSAVYLADIRCGLAACRTG